MKMPLLEIEHNKVGLLVKGLPITLTQAEMRKDVAHIKP